MSHPRLIILALLVLANVAGAQTPSFSQLLQDRMAKIEASDLATKNDLLKTLRDCFPVATDTYVSVNRNYIDISISSAEHVSTSSSPSVNLEALARSLAVFELLANKLYADDHGYDDGVALTFSRMASVPAKASLSSAR
jgi:hypothetical protein